MRKFRFLNSFLTELSISHLHLCFKTCFLEQYIIQALGFEATAQQLPLVTVCSWNKLYIQLEKHLKLMRLPRL